MGIFSGKRPANLGYATGKFARPSWKPNTVSSTVEQSDKHYIEPLPITGSATVAWKRLHAIIVSSKGAAIVTDGEAYIYAEFSSGLLGFVDDVEFAIDAKAGVIHARSGSRLGIDDLGVNRKRIERIRQALLIG